jgi:hypothetical protein
MNALKLLILSWIYIGQDQKISASKIDIQNWCGVHSFGLKEAYIGGEKSSRKINIPSLCIRCSCPSGPCYCCGSSNAQHCWASQSDCAKQCKL